MIFILEAYPIFKMKQAILIFCLLVYSYTVFSHATTEDFDYSIVFGGGFDKDLVSLRINNTSIFENYKVDNKNAIKKGNLSLTQTNKKINLFYNGQQKYKGKVKFSYYLNIDLIVNNQIKKIKVDLRKGKVILLDYSGPEAKQTTKKITVEQLQEEVIFM